jgi:hypothetical protein
VGGVGGVSWLVCCGCHVWVEYVVGLVYVCVCVCVRVRVLVCVRVSVRVRVRVRVRMRVRVWCMTRGCILVYARTPPPHTHRVELEYPGRVGDAFRAS